MRKLTYYVACTADGFIARGDGSFDFFPFEGEHVADLLAAFPDTIPGHLREALGVRGENRWFDAVLMGRKTYEVGLAAGVTSPYPHLRQYVVSRSLCESPDPAVSLVAGDPAAAVEALKREDGGGIWLCGGATLAAALFAQIDELILKVNPLVIGSGIPLFSGPVPTTGLRVVDSKAYANGFMLRRYDVLH